MARAPATPETRSVRLLKVGEQVGAMCWPNCWCAARPTTIC